MPLCFSKEEKKNIQNHPLTKLHSNIFLNDIITLNIYTYTNMLTNLKKKKKKGLCVFFFYKYFLRFVRIIFFLRVLLSFKIILSKIGPKNNLDYFFSLFLKTNVVLLSFLRTGG